AIGPVIVFVGDRAAIVVVIGIGIATVKVGAAGQRHQQCCADDHHKVAHSCLRYAVRRQPVRGSGEGKRPNGLFRNASIRTLCVTYRQRSSGIGGFKAGRPSSVACIGYRPAEAAYPLGPWSHARSASDRSTIRRASLTPAPLNSDLADADWLKEERRHQASQSTAS